MFERVVGCLKEQAGEMLVAYSNGILEPRPPDLVLPRKCKDTDFR